MHAFVVFFLIDNNEELNEGHLLEVPQARSRSKSVDHELPMMIQNYDFSKKCAKCGHDIKQLNSAREKWNCFIIVLIN